MAVGARNQVEPPRRSYCRKCDDPLYRLAGQWFKTGQPPSDGQRCPAGGRHEPLPSDAPPGNGQATCSLLLQFLDCAGRELGGAPAALGWLYQVPEGTAQVRVLAVLDPMVTMVSW